MSLFLHDRDPSLRILSREVIQNNSSRSSAESTNVRSGPTAPLLPLIADVTTLNCQAAKCYPFDANSLANDHHQRLTSRGSSGLQQDPEAAQTVTIAMTVADTHGHSVPKSGCLACST